MHPILYMYVFVQYMVISFGHQQPSAYLQHVCMYMHVVCILLKQFSPPDCLCVGPHCPGAIVMTLYSAEHVQLNLAVVMPVWRIVALQ